MMNKPIFENEAEANEYIKQNVNFGNFEISYEIRNAVNEYYFDLLKKNGYIKESPLEEAKREFIEYVRNEVICIPKKTMNYIRELEKELEKIKCQK